MKKLYHVMVAPGLSYECQGDCDLNLKKGDRVVVKCERFTDLAAISDVSDIPAFENENELVNKYHHVTKGRHIEGQKMAEILRLATDADIAQGRDNESKADSAHRSTLDRIHAHKLEMKLIHTHYSLDRKMIVFQFSADGRIDFRELLRDLSGLLRVRVELRQVGVRDEASILGGIGTCGRPFCCASFLPSFNSINVKMAKQQGLSLTPQNISGACGRLKCCLQYEAENYRLAALARKKAAAEGGEKGEAGEGEDQPQDRRKNHNGSDNGKKPFNASRKTGFADEKNSGRNRRREDAGQEVKFEPAASSEDDQNRRSHHQNHHNSDRPAKTEESRPDGQDARSGEHISRKQEDL